MLSRGYRGEMLAVVLHMKFTMKKIYCLYILKNVFLSNSQSNQNYILFLHLIPSVQ